MRIILIKPNMMRSVDNKRLIWFSVDNNSCSRCIFYEITSMLSIIKLLSCKCIHWWCILSNPIFYVFVWSFCFMTEELRNITTQSILSLEGEPYVILIGKTPKCFLLIYFIRIAVVILASVLLGLSILPLIEDSSPPVVCTIMFMLWHVFMN